MPEVVPAPSPPTPPPDALRAVFGELRRRLLRSLAVLIAASVVGWYFSGDLLRILQVPFLDVMGPHRALYYTAPAEAFMSLMWIGLIAGVLLSAPYLALQVWGIFAPVFRRQRPWRFLFFAMLTAVTFVLGALFGYFGILPAVIRMLVEGFEQKAQMEAMLRVQAFMGFSLKLLFGFGLAFELPVVMFILGRLGIVNARSLWGGFRYAVVLIVVAAAIFTPPDVLWQILLALPLVLLYLLGVGAVAITGKRALPDRTA